MFVFRVSSANELLRLLFKEKGFNKQQNKTVPTFTDLSPFAGHCKSEVCSQEPQGQGRQERSCSRQGRGTLTTSCVLFRCRPCALMFGRTFRENETTQTVCLWVVYGLPAEPTQWTILKRSRRVRPCQFSR